MRIALHTSLLPGAEDDYAAAHREVPPELVAAIRAAGVTEWTIWRSGLDLFHVLDCDDYARLLSALEPLPVNIAWQARMATMQAVTHDYSTAGADAGLPVVWHLPPIVDQSDRPPAAGLPSSAGTNGSPDSDD
jgi:L-rhamnose mutarotase